MCGMERSALPAKAIEISRLSKKLHLVRKRRSGTNRFRVVWCDIMRIGAALLFGHFAILASVSAAPPPLPSTSAAQTLSARLSDASYCTACGPIACYATLRAVGDDTTLAEVVTLCQWRDGECTTIERMANAVAGAAGVRCSPVRLSPKQLSEFLAAGDRAAIVLVRKFGPEVDHAICALRTEGEFIYAMDYPQLGQWRHRDELAEVWDGEALIVWREARNQSILRWCMALLPGACLGALVSTWSTARGRRHQLQLASRRPGARDKENEKP